MKKRILLAAIFSLVFLIASVNAVAATTITFTEVFSDSPQAAYSLTGAEWSTYGITTTNAYWYADFRDPFDYKGIANGDLQTGGQTGRVDFSTPTNAVTIDWLTILSQDIHVEAYDSSNNLLDSFTYAGTGTMSGTDTLTGTGISYILFYDQGGKVCISTLTFTPQTPIPEFSTIALPVASILGLMFFFNHRKRRKED
jgi:hypothetical protein